MLCPRCGHHNLPNRSSCSLCHAPLPPTTQAQTPQAHPPQKPASSYGQLPQYNAHSSDSSHTQLPTLSSGHMPTFGQHQPFAHAPHTTTHPPHTQLPAHTAPYPSPQDPSSAQLSSPFHNAPSSAQLEWDMAELSTKHQLQQRLQQEWSNTNTEEHEQESTLQNQTLRTHHNLTVPPDFHETVPTVHEIVPNVHKTIPDVHESPSPNIHEDDSNPTNIDTLFEDFDFGEKTTRTTAAAAPTEVPSSIPLPIPPTPPPHPSKPNLEATNTAPAFSKKLPKPQLPMNFCFVPQRRLPALWKRFFAGIIDLALLGALAFLITRLFGPGFKALPHLHPVEIALFTLEHYIKPLQFTLSAFCILYLLYNVFSLSLFTQTLGKAIMHLQVIDRRGNKLTWLGAIIRALFFLPSLFLGLFGVSWILMDREYRGLHERISGSITVEKTSL
ncbi:MAG: RDD family protein [Myxococcota bacterium]